MPSTKVRCCRCDQQHAITSKRVLRRPDGQWWCSSSTACQARRVVLLARMQAALDTAWAVLERVAALPDEVVQAGRR